LPTYHGAKSQFLKPKKVKHIEAKGFGLKNSFLMIYPGSSGTQILVNIVSIRNFLHPSTKIYNFLPECSQ
jgi:hypothetical protein